MDTYEESVAWCESYAVEHGFKYRAPVDDNEKYFHTLKEAQDFFDSRYEKHKAKTCRYVYGTCSAICFDIVILFEVGILSIYYHSDKTLLFSDLSIVCGLVW